VVLLEVAANVELLLELEITEAKVLELELSVLDED
jgi:hypothetical protein